ncbi:MAG TPA: electron transfer flavoprotein subunit alpha/FixB family protein [Gaiellaceae bacterium]|nr:electron transfer flavoprotein subunit alpha/FixB family protein [Gaiellaceae bacterium]
MTVLLFVDADDELSLQAVTLAESLGEVHAVRVDGAYAPAAWAAAIVEGAGGVDGGVDAIVGPGTDRGNEVLAHIAARLDLPFAANVTEVHGDEVTRQRWGGSLLEEARIHADLKLLTAAPFAFAASNRLLQAQVLAPNLDDAVTVVEHIAPTTGGISLADAKVVVSGGRGVGSAEGFAILEELAALLDAAVGCSRVVTSAGWRPHTDQVGQTGTKVSPDLYIACGISGATQHIAGCKGAKKLLAINDDPEATIFTHADYAVIGNLHEIVPAISAELRKVRAR